MTREELKAYVSEQQRSIIGTVNARVDLIVLYCNAMKLLYFSLVRIAVFSHVSANTLFLIYSWASSFSEMVKSLSVSVGHFLSLNSLFTSPYQGECDPTYGSEFTYSAHNKELIVGDVFVRVYNEQPSFPLEVSFEDRFLL